MTDLFRTPEALLWLALAWAALLPILAWARSRRRRLVEVLGRPETLGRLVPAAAAARRRLRLVGVLAALTLFFLALAGPQWGVELTRTAGSVRHIVVAVDVSLSMLAEDLTPNRLERAKAEMSYLIDRLAGDRVGIIAFSGRAQVQSPLTVDRGAAKMFLRALKPDMLPTPGTRAEEAVRLGVRMLAPYSGDRALVLLTDGEDHGEGLKEAGAQAAEAGVRVYTLVVGLPEGAPIPLRDEEGALVGYKKDAKGETVVSRPDEDALQALSLATQGSSFRLDPRASDALLEQLEGLRRGAAVVGARASYLNRFQWPLFLGWVVLLAAFLLPEGAPAGRARAPSLRALEGEAP